MITVYPEEKGLFTFYFQEQINSEKKSNPSTKQPHHHPNKKAKKKKYKKNLSKQTHNFKTEPSETSKLPEKEQSLKDIFLSKIIYNKNRMYGRQLSPIDEKKTQIPLIASRKVNLTQLINGKTLQAEIPNTVEEQYTFEGNCRNLRQHFYHKAKTQGRQQVQQTINSSDFKLPLIKSTKLTKAFHNLIQQDEERKNITKPIVFKSSKEKKNNKKLLVKGSGKKQRSKEPLIREGEHLAIVELSCVQHNNCEWPQRKKKFMKRLGRKI